MIRSWFADFGLTNPIVQLEPPNRDRLLNAIGIELVEWGELVLLAVIESSTGVSTS
jgi:hypothetical protein